ncbi:MAG: hypothetical protein QM796_14535 [Chthoniobacteraceae bacterium]
MKTRVTKSLTLSLGLAFGVLGCTSAFAQKAFDGGGATFLWSNTANWNPDGLPGTGDNVVFDNSATTLTGQTVILDTTAATANNLQFGSSSGTALGAFTFQGSSSSTARTLTLTSGGVTVDSSVTGAQSITKNTGNFILNSSTGTVTFTNNSSQTLSAVITSSTSNFDFSPSSTGLVSIDIGASGGATFASLNDGTATTALITDTNTNARVLTLNGTGSHTFGGLIAVSGSGTNNNFQLSIGASLVQTLTANNTFGGNVTVAAGGTLLENGAHTTMGSYNISGKIGGTGTLSNSGVRTVTLNAGAGLTPGGDGSVGTYTINLGSGASGFNFSAATAGSSNSGEFVFDLATTAASDKFVATTSTSSGTFDLGALDHTDFTFNQLAGFGVGTYTLIDYNRAFTGSTAVDTSSFDMGNGFMGALSLDNTNFDVLLNVFTVPEPNTLVTMLAGIGVLVGYQRGRRSRKA